MKGDVIATIRSSLPHPQKVSAMVRPEKPPVVNAEMPLCATLGAIERAANASSRSEARRADADVPLEGVDKLRREEMGVPSRAES